LQDPPKFTQIWIFGLKTNPLATLFWITVDGGALEADALDVRLDDVEHGRPLAHDHRLLHDAGLLRYIHIRVRNLSLP
jgi:hypothetical protein